ncbi:MAG: hypothetical protein AAGA08_01505 [Pseudomonadota bacterium]
MKKLILATTLATLSANQAIALSCVKSDVAGAFQAASASDLVYVVLKGKFAFNAVPEADKLNPEAVSTDSVFSGRLLTGAGFTQQVRVAVTLNMDCAASWCARITPDTDYIAFVEQTETELTFNVDPCYSFAFKEPEQEAVKRLENCAQGGACNPAEN